MNAISYRKIITLFKSTQNQLQALQKLYYQSVKQSEIFGKKYNNFQIKDN